MRVKELIKTKIDADFNKNTITVYVYKTFKVFLTKDDEEAEQITDKTKDKQMSILFSPEDNGAEENLDDEIKNKLKNVDKKEKDSFINELTKEKPQIFFKKNFKISEDYKSIIIDEKTYQIPDFFNKETIKTKDPKTWEMIIYYFFEKEINQKMKILMAEPSPNFVEKLRKLKSAPDNEEN